MAEPEPTPTPEPEPTPTPEPEPTPEPSDNWREGIKDDKVRKHSERFDSIDALATGNYEQRQKLSNAIVPLGKNATAEEVSAYRKSAGLPETAAGYEFQVGENVTEENVNYWKDVFFDNNVDPTAASAIIDASKTAVQNAKDAQAAEDKKFFEASDAALREDWQGEEYTKNVEYNKRAAKEIFGEDFDEFSTLETKDGHFVGDIPMVVRALAKVGREMGEGRLGTVISDDEKSSILERADEARSKAVAAMNAGKHAESKRWDAKEREYLALIPEPAE